MTDEFFLALQTIRRNNCANKVIESSIERGVVSNVKLERIKTRAQCTAFSGVPIVK